MEAETTESKSGIRNEIENQNFLAMEPPLEFSSEDTGYTDPLEEDASKSLFECTGEDEETPETSCEKGTNESMELDSFDDEFSDDEESEDEEMDESEIDSMLEQGLPQSKRLEKKAAAIPEKFRKGVRGSEPGSELTIKKLVVLEEKGGNTFEVLPGGWIQVRHSSGMPLYLHRGTRVCSLAKPYYLGPASVRRHSIPLSGIPCLAYQRALEKEQKDKELLEEQAKELENQQEDITVPEDSQATDLLSKCLNSTTNKDGPKKCPLSSPDLIAEKINSLKRKLEEENELLEKCKRDKNETDGLEADITEQIAKAKIAENVTKDTEKVYSLVANAVVNNNSTENPVNSQQKDKKNSSESPTKTRNNKRGNKSMPGAKNLIPLAKVETARENAHLYSVPPLDLREYCKRLFKFAEVECKRFKTWSARRKHTKEQKRRQLERPSLPDNAQVIKFFDMSSCKGSNNEQMVKKFNDYVFNPNGKSSVCILHEFVQHALRKQPTYSFQELENAATPYSATVMINESSYGVGYGSSKKTAKAEAAKATLEALIPQMKGQLNGNKVDPGSEFDITEYFQQVDMSDARISKMCTSVSEPSPYTLLLTCLQRSFGKNDSSNVKFEMLPADLSKGNPPNQFKMTAGEHSVTVTASNKREGKQLASQLLLSKMHPHITNFGAFIKMYGNGSIKSVKEKKQEEQQITTLQSKASANSPNWAILNKLREEMMKLSEQAPYPSKRGSNNDHSEAQSPSVNMYESDENMSDPTTLS